MARVVEHFSGDVIPAPVEITNALWCACHGGQRETAEYLFGRGADLNWVGYDESTPLDAARRGEANELAQWLVDQGCKSAKDSG